MPVACLKNNANYRIFPRSLLRLSPCPASPLSLGAQERHTYSIGKATRLHSTVRPPSPFLIHTHSQVSAGVHACHCHFCSWSSPVSMPQPPTLPVVGLQGFSSPPFCWLTTLGRLRSVIGIGNTPTRIITTPGRGGMVFLPTSHLYLPICMSYTILIREPCHTCPPIQFVCLSRIILMLPNGICLPSHCPAQPCHILVATGQSAQSSHIPAWGSSCFRRSHAQVLPSGQFLS